MADELILIVEDNPLNLKLLRDVLTAQGYRVAEAHTGEDGVAMALAEPPDLVLMDIQLPGMDGVAALGELKRDPSTRNVPVIAVTASAMPMERKEILEAGFDGYQAKPISVKEISAEIRALLAGGGS